MAISKNFVVKNGLEVATNLIVADTDLQKVGIGTTTPRYKFEVGGGIGATDLYISGFSTFIKDLQVGTSGSVFYVSDANNFVGIGTSVPAYTLDVRGPVSTGVTALYVYGDAQITGDLSIDDFTVDELYVTGISTLIGFSTFEDNVFIQDGLNVTGTGITATTLEITGVSTFTGIGTFLSDLYVGGDLYISEDITLDTNLNILGIATIGTLDVTNYALIQAGLVVTGSGTTTTTLDVSGVSTFTGAVDVNGDIDVDGHTELDDLNVSGVSTFVGIGTFQSDLYVAGDLDVTGSISYAQATSTNLEVTGIATIGTTLDVNGDIDVDGHTELDDVNVSGASTFVGAADFNGGLTANQATVEDISNNNVVIAGTGGRLEGDSNLTFDGSTLSVGVDLDVDGHTELDDLNVSGVATITSLDVQSNFDVYDSQATFHNDVLISGNLSIGGTLATVFVDDLRVSDKDLILGFTTDTSNNDVSNDDTANHGGIAIASTEGNPLVPFTLTGINTLPDTYKQIMWVKADSYGFGTTDAWLFNYGVGIGSTLVPNGVRLAVSEIQFTDDTIDTPNITITEDASISRNFSVTGLSTFTGNIDANGDLDVDGHTELDNLNVSGVSTFAGAADFNGDLDVDGITELDITNISETLNVTGVSTFASSVDINAGLDVDGHTELDDVNVSGFSTFVGFSTFNDYVYVQDGLNVAGVTTATEYTIDGTTVISNSRELQNIASLDATTTATIESAIANAPNTFTDISVSGLSTFVGVGTFQSDLYVAGNLNVTGDLVYDEVTGRNLNITGIATIGTTLDVDGDIDVDGHTELDDLNVSGVSTFVGTADFNGDIDVDGHTELDDLNVSGIATIGTVQISSGIITATAGDVVYYGDGSYLTGNARNLTATIGIGTSGGVVGYGVSFLDLRGAGVSTAFYDGNVGIATIFFEGGGGGGSASIGIGSTPGDAFVGVVTAGNLWYNTDLGRLFIYYQDVDSAQWVDAAPFNVGVITSLSNVSFVPGSAVSPSMYFIGDTQTGFFSPTPGQFTIVSTGSSVLNINPSGINVTGIATAQDFDALSDINFKENVTTVNNALLKVDQLRGVKFDWKESGNPSYGVIAQELEQVLPELVHGNDPKTVNYNGIIGVLIEAIKELKAEVEELKNTK